VGPPIHQFLYEVEREEKFSLLLSCLAEQKPESAIVFCNLKVTVAELAEALENEGLSSASLHGDLDQNDRDRVMAKFRNGSLRVLVATDVAARGIDVADLDLVVNFELPKPDIYVHRIGRTGRAGKSGVAISFLSPGEGYKVRLIEEKTGQQLEVVMAPKLEASAEIPREAKMVTLYIGGGRKDKLRPGDILGALTGEAGALPAAQVGKIEIHDRFAYVAVDKEIAESALEALRNGKIKGRKFRCEMVL
jgi:ATP-independent RNA helicase DbpA